MRYIKKTIIIFVSIILCIAMISCTEKQAQKQKPEQPEEPTEKPINYTEAMTDMKREYSDYINYRQYLVNANKKMTEDKELSVLFFGGSLTEGHGATDKMKYSWRGRTCDWFEKNFPDVNFTFHNKAVGESGTFLGTYRLKIDVIDVAPDVIFLEYSINDRYFASSYDDAFMRCETIVREIKEALPKTDIIMLITTDADCMKENQQGKLHTQGQAHEDVAKAYDVSTLHVGMLLANKCEYSSETFRNKYAIDVVHLNDEGYGIYFDCVSEYLENSLKKTDFSKVKESKQEFPMVGKVLFDGNRSYIQPSQAVLDASTELGGTGVTFTDKNYSPKSALKGVFGMSDGDVLAFSFTGTEVAMWCSLVNGEYLVSIDGGEYVSKSTTQHNPAVIASNLASKEHIIKIKVANSDSEFSIGSIFIRDASLATKK